MMNQHLMILLSGLSIGFIGSVHCIGMCGPLALSLPIHQFSKHKIFFAIINYNLGRAITYSVMGFLFGVFGMGFSIFKLQQTLSIASGILILLILFSIKSKTWNFSFLKKAMQYLHVQISGFIKQAKSPLQFFGIGFANGFLPCGLVYVALIAGVATGNIIDSSILLFGFGLGTMPLMIATMYLGKFISIPIRKKIGQLTPYMIGAIAMLLILRGMSIGIPYISPKMQAEKVSCCHK